jgi:hypothetical protein
VNDFNASVRIGTTIGRNFVTTWKYASARVKMASHDDLTQWSYLEVDDFASACAVLCEHAGIELPAETVFRVAFAANRHSIPEGDPFHRFLGAFHGVLSTCITHREVSAAEKEEVKQWVQQTLLFSPEDAFMHYSSSS